MQTPVEVDFQGMQPVEAVRETVARHVAGLESRSGRFTAARVVVKGPGGHHRTGGLYEINIHLALPNGREVNVTHTPQADERHSDIDFAINDAFKRARRQLQDQVRHLQNQIKTSRRAVDWHRDEPQRRFRLSRSRRWARSIFQSQQRAERWVRAAENWSTRDLRRRDGRKRPASQHREASWQTWVALMAND